MRTVHARWSLDFAGCGLAGSLRSCSSGRAASVWVLSTRLLAFPRVEKTRVAACKNHESGRTLARRKASFSSFPAALFHFRRNEQYLSSGFRSRRKRRDPAASSAGAPSHPVGQGQPLLQGSAPSLWPVRSYDLLLCPSRLAVPRP
jgi:hypothetical protein